MPQLPSGIKLYLSKLSVIDFERHTEWFRCPEGHFWFMTPNLSVSLPPYKPTDEIVLDFLSAPIPKSREEAKQFVHVLFEDPVHGMYWRGDWLDSFENTFHMSTNDRVHWKEWLDRNQDFLDLTIKACFDQAATNKAMIGTYKNFPGEYMINMMMTANSIGKEIVPQKIKIYPLSELTGRKHRLPESIRQADYEVAVQIVGNDLSEQGFRIAFADKSPEAYPSLIAETRTGRIGVKVVVARAPDEASFTQSDIEKLKSSVSGPYLGFAIAPVGLLPTSPRSPEGDPGFHVKYNGIKKV